MDRVRAVWKRLRGLVTFRARERELNDELAFHIELEIEQNIRLGMTPENARRAAHVAFGGVERYREGVLEVRSVVWLETLMQDLRHAIRSYRRTPGFTLVVVLTLALGICGATTIFGVVDAVMLRPLPYPDPDRLVHVKETNPDGMDFVTSEPNFLDFAGSNRTFESLGAYRLYPMTAGGETPEQVHSLAASHQMFDVLGARIALGRAFTREEDTRGGSGDVVVLSDGYWRSGFGADPTVIGRTLLLDGTPHTVVGVFSPEMRFMRADLWRPLRADPATDRGNHWLDMVGRLAPGVSLEQATDDLAGISRGIAASHQAVAGWGVRMVWLSEWLVGPRVRDAGGLLLAAVAFLLLMACANVANLLLARATTRQTDLSIRAALGAGRHRLTRQMLAESGVLAAAGAMLGVLGAYWIVAALRRAAPEFIPRVEEITLDARVLVFALAVTVVTALLVGLLPAREAARVNVHSVLKHGGRTGSSRAQQIVRESLVVAQIAVAVLLLIGGGLMVRSLLRLYDVDPGFDTEHLWSVRLQPLAEHYPEEWQRARFFNVVTDRLEQLPGVVAAGATVVGPFSGFNLVNDVTPEERARATPESGFMQAAWRVVTPDGYFEAAGVPLLRGRFFSFDRDRYEVDPVVIVTRSMAERMWPGENPIGKRLFWGGTSGRPRTVIGVVGDVQDVAIDEPPQPMMFLPTSQLTWAAMVVLVRTAGDLAGAPDAIRRTIHEIDPAILVPEIRRVDDSLRSATAQPRTQTWILAGFAAIALGLAAVGLYGMLSFAVAQRTREIGVRMALGARAEAVLALMVRRGLSLAAAGTIIGLSAAAGLTRFIGTLLYDTPALDPLTFGAVALVFAITALAATALPALRAARVDPNAALRSE
jgi:predicted permease